DQRGAARERAETQATFDASDVGMELGPGAHGARLVPGHLPRLTSSRIKQPVARPWEMAAERSEAKQTARLAKRSPPPSLVSAVVGAALLVSLGLRAQIPAGQPGFCERDGQRKDHYVPPQTVWFLLFGRIRGSRGARGLLRSAPPGGQHIVWHHLQVGLATV